LTAADSTRASVLARARIGISDFDGFDAIADDAKPVAFPCGDSPA
jgi:hypothetical protein